MQYGHFRSEVADGQGMIEAYFEYWRYKFWKNVLIYYGSPRFSTETGRQLLLICFHRTLIAELQKLASFLEGVMNVSSLRKYAGK